MFEKEEWRDVKGYEGNYQISSFGRLRRLVDQYGRPNIHIIKGRVGKAGYRYTLLYDGHGKYETKKFHRLVAQAFLPDYSDDLFVNHRDENKLNNHVSNLEMCDAKYNVQYGTGLQRRAEKQRNDPNQSYVIVRIEDNVLFPSLREIERTLKLKHSNVSYAIKHNTRCGGYHWRRATEQESQQFRNQQN